LPPLNGEHVKVSVVEVTYAPGESSRPHTHPCPVIGYVVEGRVRIQVKGGSEKTFAAGETFYEAANGVHLISANAGGDRAAHRDLRVRS
jgi:quercetin dioxygenase-like cupin family protein